MLQADWSRTRTLNEQRRIERERAASASVAASPVLAFDRSAAQIAFMRAKRLEADYAMRLRQIAKHIGDVIRGFPEGTYEAASAIGTYLERYAIALNPWAEAVARRMVTQVAAHDDRSWRKVAAQMGRALRQEIETAPTGVVMRGILADQVKLITSLPVEAAERVHKLTQEGITQGKRSTEIAKQILETGDVTRSRAELIARTEVSRTATVLTQARAQHIGSTHFVWRTAGDRDVRPTHRALNRQTFRWDDPPVCDDPNIRSLPGSIWNCRCVAIPVIPD